MSAAALSAQHAYAAESIATRVHVNLRWRTCPFVAVAELVPRQGSILDAGCGHGLLTLYLALQEPGRRVTGVDIDGAKLAVARRAAAAAGVANRVEFVEVTPGWEPAGSWDAIVEVDMLYLLGRSRATAWLAHAARALRSAGVLVVKELDVLPAWKARWSRLQELFATRVLRITEGEDLELVPSVDVVASMRAAGLSASVARLDRHRLHPHYAAVGTRGAES